MSKQGSGDVIPSLIALRRVGIMAVKIKGLKLSGFSSMSSDRQKEAISKLTQVASEPTLEQIEDYKKSLEKSIKNFEIKYGFSSEEMRSQLAAGYIVEDMNICSWLMLLEDLKFLREKIRSPRPK